MNKALPSSEQSERAVLGICLTCEDKLLDVISALTTQDFYFERHVEIFRAIQFVSESGFAVNVLSVSEQLKRAGKLDEIGRYYLVELCGAVASGEDWKYPCEVLKEKRIAREMVSVSVEIYKSAVSPMDSPRQALETASNKFLELLAERSENTTQPVIHYYAQEIQRSEDILEHGLKPGIPTGIASLDEMLLGGWHDADVTILAARPSMGKTSLSLQMAMHAGFNLKIPTLYFSVEMTGQKLMWSLIAKKSKLKISNLVRGAEVQKTALTLVNDNRAYLDSKLYINDSNPLSPARLRMHVKNAVARWGVKLVFVDYLQLMHAGELRYESSNAKFTFISGAIKQMAKEFRIPFVILSQLTRGSEKENRKPMLSDLRESGAIEQDADGVIFIHDPNFYEYGRREDLSTKELIVAKHRLGPTGSIEIGFRREFAEFVELSHMPEITPSNGRHKQIEPPRYANVPAFGEEDLPF